LKEKLKIRNEEKQQEVAHVNPGNFWFLKLGANHADLHIRKLMKGKAKGNNLTGKSQKRLILKKKEPHRT